MVKLNLSQFVRESHRRRVFQTAALYIVACWVILQAAALAFPGLDIPDSAIRYVWIATFLGFPISLLFGWRYQITAKGIVRTAPMVAGEPAGDLALKTIDHVLLSALALVAVVISYGAIKEIQQVEQPFDVSALEAEIFPNSIAVLPLENLSADPEQEYFVSGMQDALIASLSGISGLRVTSKTSTLRFRDGGVALPDVANELSVASLIEGSVYKVDRRVRITVKLMDARQDRNVWTQSFEEDIADVLSLQRDIAREIANQVRVTITRDEEAALASAEKVDPKAYEAFLKGQFHVERFTPQDLSLAEQYYKVALETDPDYALAILGLGRVCGFRAQAGLIGPSEARETCLPLIDRALELDDSLAEAYLGYARHMTWQEFNWEAAGLAFRRAVELNPSYAEARMFYSHYLTLVGKPKDGTEQMALARSLDPLNPFVEALHGARLMMVGDLQGSVDVVSRVHANYPGFGFGHLVVWQANYGMGNEAEAIAAAVRHFRITRGDPIGAEALESAYHNGDFTAAVANAAGVLIEHGQTRHVPPMNIAILFEQAGLVEQAIDWYEIAFQSYDPTAPYMGVLVKSSEIRTHPRFIALLRDMRLDHWANDFSGTDD